MQAGENIDPSSAIREAVLAAKELAENAAWAVREVLEAVGDEAKAGIIIVTMFITSSL